MNRSDGRKDLGDRGEAAACAYLERKGYRILERNWRCAEGELDIIARDGETLCFIEVRTKSPGDHGHPLDTITAPKQRQVIRVATRYLQQRGLEESPVRFDALGLVAKGKSYEITHIPAAFEVW
jgi:putative endonuclease